MEWLEMEVASQSSSKTIQDFGLMLPSDLRTIARDTNPIAAACHESNNLLNDARGCAERQCTGA